MIRPPSFVYVKVIVWKKPNVYGNLRSALIEVGKPLCVDSKSYRLIYGPSKLKLIRSIAVSMSRSKIRIFYSSPALIYVLCCRCTPLSASLRAVVYSWLNRQTSASTLFFSLPVRYARRNTDVWEAVVSVDIVAIEESILLYSLSLSLSR